MFGFLKSKEKKNKELLNLINSYTESTIKNFLTFKETFNVTTVLGLRLIKSTIQEPPRGRRKQESFLPICRSV